MYGTRIASTVRRPAMDWKPLFQNHAETKKYLVSRTVQTGSGAYKVCNSMDTMVLSGWRVKATRV
jgi:hypothetical protein